MSETPKSDALEIEKEKQKTIRYGIYAVVLLVLLVGAFWVFSNKDVKKLNLNIKEGTVGLEKYDTDKPLTEQVKTETSVYKKDGETIEYTTGSISQDVIKTLQKEHVTIKNNEFTGHNFISEKSGFLFYCPSPESWNVVYNEAALVDPVNNNLYTYTHRKDERFKVEVTAGTNNYNMTLQEFVGTLGLSAMYSGLEMNDVKYEGGNIAFMAYNTPDAGTSSIVKIIATGKLFYIVGCTYPAADSGSNMVSEMKQMVSSFSLIG